MELDTAGDSVRWPYQTVINWKWETEIKIPSPEKEAGFICCSFQGPIGKKNCLVQKKIVWHGLCQRDGAGGVNQPVSHAHWAAFVLRKVGRTSHPVLTEVELSSCDHSGSANRAPHHALEAAELFYGRRKKRVAGVGGFISIQKVTNSNLDLIRS